MKQYNLLSLQRLNEPYAERLKEAAAKVIDSGWYLRGTETETFEKEIATYLGTPHVIGVANGLDALRLIFKAYIALGRLQPGDEVIVPANTFIASVLAITDCHLTPRFVEPDATTHNIDFDRLQHAITPHTRAILIVHLYGQLCWSETLQQTANKHNLLIIEDNAQALGARTPDGRATGSLGNAAATSFYPGKNLGALGDAGMVTTHNEQLAQTIRAMANYGGNQRYIYQYQGLNSRIDELQAALLRVKLPHLDSENNRRSAISLLYNSLITNPHITLPQQPLHPCTHVWHQYIIRTTHREALMQHLRRQGIETGIHYPIPPHKQEAYREYNHIPLPIAEQLANEVVSIPIAPYLTDIDIQYIANAINQFKRKR